MSRLRSRVVAAALDQAWYSLQSFAVAFTALHALALDALGAFALASTLLVLVQVALRALTAEPLTIRFSNRADIQPAVASAAGAAVLAGAAILMPCLLVWVTGSRGGPLLVSAGVALLALMVQDTYRFALFAQGRVWSATTNDGIVCLTTLAAIGVLAVGEAVKGPTLLLAWAAGSLTGSALGAWQLGALPRPFSTRDWLHAQQDIALPLMGSVVAQQSMGRLSLVLVSALAGSAQLGLLSASRTVLTPVNTLIAATYSFAVPEAVRRKECPSSLVRFTTVLSAVLALVAVALTIVLLTIPAEWGRVLAGRNWDGARALLVPTSLWIVGVALSQGARVGLRALERTDAIFRLSLPLGVVVLVSTVIGTLVNGGAGAAWGFGVASLLGQPAWTWAYRRALHAHRRHP